jgi:hypothetical protein
MLKHILKGSIIAGTSLLVLGTVLLTLPAGRGQCPQCGYLHDLHACKYCGWTACGACWKKMGEYTCPNCGRGSP